MIRNFIERLLLAILMLCQITVSAQTANEVTIVGQIKDAMWKGEISGKINLDTLSQKENLYGIGPVEFLSGEVLIIDGKSYKSTVGHEGEMKVEETFDIRAPFFGYAYIPHFRKVEIPDSVSNIAQLERFIDEMTKEAPRPFMFKLTGLVEQASIHIVNLPKGTTVSSPAQAHEGMVNYSIFKEQADIVGFFSTRHQTIFTHHDTFLHIHLITRDREKMGHVDKLSFSPQKMMLFLPEQK